MKNFGLIGFPLGHSFSKKFFTEKFEKESIDAQFDLFELKGINEFPALVESIELSGLNVTIPYKKEVIPYLDELDETAAEIGAVNVIKFMREGGKLTLKGYNSDLTGFENSIRSFLKPYHQKALILGTGGASKAIEYSLRKAGIEITFVSRTSKPNAITYTDLSEEIISDHFIIVNASPVGTFPHTHECPDIPYEFLTDKHFLFDVVYNPAETLFLKKGKAKGAQVLNGQAMLIGQALEAWKIWNEE